MADRIIQMKDNQGNNLFPLVKISPSILEGSYLPITGGILTGDLILKGDPTSLLMPATKQYVDNKFGNYLPLSGGTVTGQTIFSKIGYGTESALIVGGTASNISSNVTSALTSMIQIDAGTGGATNACGVGFHNPGVSSASLGYYNTDVNNGTFRFYSDSPNWGVSINGSESSYKLYVNGDTRIDGHAMFCGGSYTDNMGLLYYNGGIEIREKGLCGTSQSAIGYGPTLGFHWGGRVASSFTLGSDHILYYYNNSGALGTLKAGSIWGAVWNDYAEYRKSNDNEPGRVVMEDKKGILQRVTERLQSFAGVVSDTFGFAQGETDDAKTPLAVAGRVLVYPYRPREEYNTGDCVCAAPDGTVDIMTRQEIRDWPDRIVGTVSEIPDYETWGTGNVEVNGRIWIKVR